MSVLVSQANIAAFYRSLWEECADAPLPQALANGGLLPPFLCRRLAFGDPRFQLDAGLETAMTGMPDGTVRRIEERGCTLHWASPEVHPALFEFLPLAGHRLADESDQREALLREALGQLAQLGSGFADSLRDFTGVLIWLEQKDPEAEPFNSSSFPALPHATLVTDLAARAIPPSTRLPEPRARALAENLYHESLHQQLCATMLQVEFLDDAYAVQTAPRIPIPWQGEAWEVDRVLHAVAVYARLIPMRRRVLARSDLDPLERAAWSEAHKGGSDSLAFLATRLHEERGWFTKAGRAFVEQVCADAHAAVDGTAP